MPLTMPYDHMKKAVQEHNSYTNGGRAERERMNLNFMIELLDRPNLKHILLLNLLHEINKCPSSMLKKKKKKRLLLCYNTWTE